MSINKNAPNRFDEIDNYDDEIPKHVADYLNDIKTQKNLQILKRFSNNEDESQVIKGLDLGCGTGGYMAYLQNLQSNLMLDGLDYSEKQLTHAKNKGLTNHFIHASMSDISMVKDDVYNFAYAINSIHHLPSIDDQKKAFSEVYRILKKEGVFIIHEINTKNPVIKFYVNYIFPRIRNIDDGSEIWLTEQLVKQTEFSIEEIQYFTFVPDFTPKFAMKFMTNLDSYLSKTSISVLGAHVMYILKKA